MSRRGLRIFGHPVHAMVVGFPIALWVAGSLGDLVALARGGSFWPQLAFWSLAAGSVTALPAAISGFWDFVSLPPGHRAEGTAWWHMGVMGGAFALEATSLILRRGDLGEQAAAPSAMLLALGGALLCLAGGWLGGELVFRHGVGVEGSEPGSLATAGRQRLDE